MSGGSLPVPGTGNSDWRFLLGTIVGGYVPFLVTRRLLVAPGYLRVSHAPYTR